MTTRNGMVCESGLCRFCATWIVYKFYVYLKTERCYTKRQKTANAKEKIVIIDFAPGMRAIIRDEEWMVKKIETNSLGNKALYCVGIIMKIIKDLWKNSV